MKALRWARASDLVPLAIDRPPTSPGVSSGPHGPSLRLPSPMNGLLDLAPPAIVKRVAGELGHVDRAITATATGSSSEIRRASTARSALSRRPTTRTRVCRHTSLRQQHVPVARSGTRVRSVKLVGAPR